MARITGSIVRPPATSVQPGRLRVLTLASDAPQIRTAIGVIMGDLELRDIPQRDVPGTKTRPAGLARRMINSPLMPVGLGVLSVVAALAIGYFAYQHSLASGEQQLRQFYLSKARMLVAGTDSPARRPDSELLAAVQLLWDDSGPKAPDEYLCIIDNESVLVLHTARPETQGHFVGDNVVLGDRESPTCRLQDLTESREDRVGGYVSSAGEEQIAAFVSFPRRNWCLGVHRSRAAFDAEVRAGLSWLGFALLGVCGLLLPASLVTLHGTMRRLGRRREQADTALRESEERFRQLVENIHEVFWMENAAGTELLYVSPAYEQIWGRSCREFYENPRVWIEAIHAEDRERVVEAFGRFRETGTYSEEFRIVRPDGSIRWIWDRGVLIYDESGQIHRMAGAAEDVTERRQAEETLHRFEHIVSSSTDMLAMLDKDYVYLAANEAYRSAFDRTAAELIGHTAAEVFGNDFFESTIRPHAERCLAGEEVRYAAWFEFSACERQYMDIAYFPYVDANREISGFVVCTRNITKRKKAEEALTEQERHFRLFSLSTGDCFWNWDMVAGTVERSSGFDRAFGYQEQDIQPDIEWWAERIHPQDKERVLKTFEAAVAGEQLTTGYEYRFRCRDDSYAAVDDHVCLIRDATGKVVRSLGAMRDITERRQAEEKLRESSELLKAVHEANPDLQFVLASDGTITSYHAHVDADLYESPKNFIGKKMQDVLPAAVGERFLAAFATAIASGSLVTIEYELCMPAGERMFEGRIVPLPDQRLVVTVRNITERKQHEEERELLLHNTGERAKELRCMYGVAESIRTRKTLEQVFEDVVALVPLSWQYPQITRGRIRFDDREYVSQPFEETEWRQSAEIVIAGEVHGTAEVFYLEERPEFDEGPFLKEERNLIDGVARALSEAVEHKLAEAALRRSNRALRVLSECNEALVRSADEKELLESLCKTIVDSGGYRLVWIGFAEQDRDKTVRPVAQSGGDDEYLSSLNITWADSDRGRGPTGTAIRSRTASIAQKIMSEPHFAPWREAACEHDYGSSIALPLCDESGCLGALNIYASEPDAFDVDEVKLLSELAEDLCYGIRSQRTRRAQVQAEAETAKLNAELESRVLKRTVQLEVANKELESFAYSVSHDLRAPLRGIDGFSKALLEDYGETLDQTGKDFLNRVRAGTQRMSDLIDDLLDLSRITRSDFRDENVDLSAVAREIGEELEATDPDRSAKFVIQPGAVVEGDTRLLRLVLSNLLSNAWKFTRDRKQAKIEFGSEEGDDAVVYFVRDNGAGFDMDYVDKLFNPFQRLHSTAEFPGTGIGLAIVQRVIRRHGGRVWAEGAVGQGATFYFTVGSYDGSG